MLMFFKGCVRYILASLFLSIKECSLCEARKKKLFHFKSSFWFSRKSNFRILDIQISRRLKIPKHKTKTFLLNNLETKDSVSMNLTNLCHITKGKKFLKNFHINFDLKTSPRRFCVRIRHNLC